MESKTSPQVITSDSNANYPIKSTDTDSDPPNIRYAKELQELRAKIYADPKLSDIKIEDRFLLTTLYSSLGDNRDTYKTLREFLLFFQKYDYFRPEFPTNAEKIIKANVFTVSKAKKDDGSGLIIINCANWKLKSGILFDELVRVCMTMIHIELQDEKSHRGGFQILADLRGVTWKHATKFSISYFRFMADLQKFCTWQVRKVHILYDSFLIGILRRLAVPALGKELHQKVIFHDRGLESLYEHCPKNMLPSKLGGNFDDEFTFEENMEKCRQAVADWKEIHKLLEDANVKL
ncbi:retinaldehyde-binding protein 1-like [Brevipalpus obovatus]|uniref:retinaldehyde-binding protein 1-like n=1 Tax=Brevipalpus obovatus TaxID=246614 RepID=UPI003D9DD7FF